jgi:hypothetical protein
MPAIMQMLLLGVSVTLLLLIILQAVLEEVPLVLNTGMRRKTLLSRVVAFLVSVLVVGARDVLYNIVWGFGRLFGWMCVPLMLPFLYLYSEAYHGMDALRDTTEFLSSVFCAQLHPRDPYIQHVFCGIVHEVESYVPSDIMPHPHIVAGGVALSLGLIIAIAYGKPYSTSETSQTIQRVVDTLSPIQDFRNIEPSYRPLLVLILAARRRRDRHLPDELWLLIHDDYMS